MTFAAWQWERNKHGQWNVVWLIDLLSGSDYCVYQWVVWKTG